ncbi:hypothetical protein EYC84_005842 [Monilinia fructicola]|uniref:Uncharacterized protein n=1 Tax=Monilinia fructicola TaxID=38448 RepID=A0A5M9JYR1_MONFR|nr:hypothetical protein EYC84_005842 [Monilinia fructicola]
MISNIKKTIRYPLQFSIPRCDSPRSCGSSGGQEGAEDRGVKGWRGDSRCYNLDEETIIAEAAPVEKPQRGKKAAKAKAAETPAETKIEAPAPAGRKTRSEKDNQGRGKPGRSRRCSRHRGPSPSPGNDRNQS